MKKIRIALAGVGNCASALIQGVEYYRNSKNEPIGVAQIVGKYAINDIEFVLGFDVHKEKVGRPLTEAIFEKPNCADFLYKPEQEFGMVYKGHVFDGLDSNISQHVPVDELQEPEDAATLLKENSVDILIILLPTGSQKAAEYYAKAAIEAGCGIVNGMPADIANNPTLVARATENNIPIIGDDIKSQIGATIIHRALTNLFPMRNASMDRTIQLDWGGDMDFCNLTSNQRYETGGKRRSKTESVIEGLPNKDTVDVQISAVDYIPFLQNQKEAYTRLEGRIFGGKQVRIDVMLQVQDAYNSAGILVDALRVLMIAKDREIGGVIDVASSMFNKRPPKQLPDVVAREQLDIFIKGK
ncbi:MAG: inositol-3-phosphate synthase [Candidatus Moranbacteria bacterium]|nr:inositol-3-phosphate synthase [Candidatus Moranbacteria bacterium]